MRTCELGEVRHSCGLPTCEANVTKQIDSEVFCNSPHPTTVTVGGKQAPVAHCRRQSHESGSHSAFIAGVRVPSEWS
jgi:hypothetical protein